CGHGRLRGRRAARDGLGRGRSRQRGGDSSSASNGSARVMSCPKASRATPVATRPQSVAIPRSMAGTSQCSRRPRPSPNPPKPPQKLGSPFFVYDHGHQVLVIPDCPKATVWIAIHAEHRYLPLRRGRRTEVLRVVARLHTLAVALFAGQPVAGPRALGIAALF